MHQAKQLVLPWVLNCNDDKISDENADVGDNRGYLYDFEVSLVQSLSLIKDLLELRFLLCKSCGIHVDFERLGLHDRLNEKVEFDESLVVAASTCLEVS